MTPDVPPPTANELAQQRTGLADDRTKLAVTRTTVALDRTLMAWVRTAVSLISFGFTIYKFFQGLPPVQSPRPVMTPRAVGLVLIGIGVGGLVLATLEYRTQMAQLQKQFAQYGPFHRSTAVVVASVIAGLGVVGFVLVFLRR